MDNDQRVKLKVKVYIFIIFALYGGLLFIPSDCLAADCLAYVGPGSGVTMLWALLAVLGGILFMVLGLLLWPLRMLIRAIKKNKSKNESVSNLNTDNSDNIVDDKQTLLSPEHS